MSLGCKYGTHRVIEPVGAMPQTAQKINNDMSILYDNEILVDVIALNVDSASFTQIEQEAGGDVQKIGAKILEIVAARGKQQNPVTGSGGMLIGKVAKIGSALKDRDLKVGDKIASLVSLSLTPLKINKILKVHPEIDRSRSTARPSSSRAGSTPNSPRTWTKVWPWRPWMWRALRPRRPSWSSPGTRSWSWARAASPASCASTSP